MSDRQAIEHALTKAGIQSRIVAGRDLSGGCIHRVVEITLADGTPLVAKANSADHLVMFQAEAAGLRTLAATNTILVPKPLAVVQHNTTAVLLMTAIEHARATNAAWRRFGEELAALHSRDTRSPQGRYGFQSDNHLGATPQPNGWCDDWVQFNADHRLGHQLTLADDRRLLRGDEAARIQRVIDRLEGLIPRRPRPALLHGDLWSGNALATVDENGIERIAAIDPACSIGDGWADIAMMRLFGGFPRTCFEVYAANVEDHDQIERRIAVYQLYHVLNHVNLFGRGYLAQAMALVARLV